MATATDNVIGLSGNPLANGLVQGSAWQFGAGPRTLTYSLSLNDNPNGGSWTTPLADGLRLAFNLWSNVANITFTEVSSGTVYGQSSADIAVVLSGNELQTSLPGLVSVGVFPSPAMANTLLLEAGENRLTYPNPEGDIVFDNYYAGYNYLGMGGIGLTLMIHEIGHALGLKHPDDDGNNGRPTFVALGINNLDSNLYTIMSYTDASGNPLGFDMLDNAATPMPLDILAIQQIYGANTTYHTGNDTYTLYGPSVSSASTIWDAGGNDTLAAGSVNQYNNCTIDLREGQISQSPTIWRLSLSIAYGVVIENAVGGDGNDTLIGNAASNNLNGGLGGDTMSGGAGDDIYIVDSISDVVAENASEGADTVQSSISYTLGANVEKLILAYDVSINGTGNTQDNRITGNSGNNILDGGAGTDTAVYSAPRSAYTISKSGSSYTITSGNDGTDTLTNIEQLAFADITMVLGDNHSPTGNVSIDGSAIQGQTLNASNTLTDLDGLGTLSYQWQGSVDGTTWNNLGTGATLLLAQAQVGQQIRVMASYTDGLGTLESVTSAATAAVANINDAPLITSAASGSIAENIAPGTVAFTFTATDPDPGQTLSYSFGGADASAFDFNPLSGTVSFKASPNYEAKSSYSIELTATDGILSTVQTVSIVIGDVATARYTVLGSGASHLDLGAYGNLSLAGQELVIKGNAGVDSIYVDSADNLLVDFTQAGLGADKLYLSGHYADYAYSYSGSVVTLARATGGSEVIKAITGDSLVFADGTVAVAAVLNFLKGTAAAPALTGEMSTVFPQAIPDGLSNTVRAVVLDASGETLALARPGEDLLVKGGSGVDTLCVTPGSQVDATQLGLGQDKVYLAGHLSDYSGSISGNAITLSRDVEGHSESVKLLGGSSSAFDSLVFLDGTAKSIDVLNYFKGGAAPALDTIQTSLSPQYAPSLIAGTAGDDTLSGTTGRDQLDGRAGTDSLSGGLGSDIFVLGHGYGGGSLASADTIADFEDGIDHIGLIGGLTFNDLLIAQGNGTDTAAGNSVIRSADGEYLALLLNISTNAITPGDFLSLSL